MTTCKQIHWLDRPIQNRACYAVCKFSLKLTNLKLNSCSCKNCPYYNDCDHRKERRQKPRTTTTDRGEDESR